ncbi:unnamed protein product [Pleuronectes platessa]|uniref:Uncharacterized protein n=1 Tax=Pleuronectes platessa TaxID=8262 RepID=A0A9N7Z4L8_PLEPL|nr:unnamed protein product [Pleuronectes platessa]
MEPQSWGLFGSSTATPRHLANRKSFSMASPSSSHIEERKRPSQLCGRQPGPSQYHHSSWCPSPWATQEKESSASAQESGTEPSSMSLFLQGFLNISPLPCDHFRLGDPSGWV